MKIGFVAAAVLTSAVSQPLAGQGVEITGYFEHTLQIDYASDVKEQLIDASKLRIDFANAPLEGLEFRANVNLIVYHGTTSRRAARICAQGFLPRKPSRRVWFAESRRYALRRAKTQAHRAHDRAAVLTCDIDLAQMRQRLGARRALVVHGLNGMDEITVSGQSRVWELSDGDINVYETAPKDFGMAEADVKTLVGGTSEENASILRSVLEGEKSPRRDAVVMNAAAAIALGRDTKGLPALKEAAVLAVETTDSGKALDKLDKLIALSRSYG